MIEFDDYLSNVITKGVSHVAMQDLNQLAKL
jgi:hypothetical protein